MFIIALCMRAKIIEYSTFREIVLFYEAVNTVNAVWKFKMLYINSKSMFWKYRYLGDV